MAIRPIHPGINGERKFFLLSSFIITLLLLSGCANYKAQSTPGIALDPSQEEPVKTFFLVSGLGDVENPAEDALVGKLNSSLQEAGESATLINIGDFIGAGDAYTAMDKTKLSYQLDMVERFGGQTYFVPGKNEWKTYDMELLEQVEEVIEGREKDKIEIEPENGCPIEDVVLSDDLDLILVDSNWFISNWSRVVDINKGCTDIITRRRFLEELEDKIDDAQDKNILIAMHHPIFSNGEFAGKATVSDHLLPMPLLGTVIQGIGDLGGFNPDLLTARRYFYLRMLVAALAKQSDRIIVVSGHEASQQFLEGGDIRQLIVGSLAEATATKRSIGRINTYGGSLEYEGKFTHGTKGFTRLDYFADGSAKATFIPAEGEATQIKVLKEFPAKKEFTEFEKLEEDVVSSRILDDPEAFNKSGFYKFLWGERFRKYFGTEVSAPVVNLDTLYGGLKVTKKGGGHQSYSIRLEDANGRQYAMRSLRKDALKFLKFKVKGVAYTGDDYEGTVAEEIVSDFFTSAHPYMQLVINPLARAVRVNHSEPDLFYVPKQPALGELNEKFGNELYFIEQRPSEEHVNYHGYRRIIDEEGEVDEFESTTDMLEKIKSDESYTIDQKDFARARLFDMLIGDWDRHQDQWRWVEYETDDENKVFLPIPRDRDNAFPRFDGAVIDVAQWFTPVTRGFESFNSEFPDLKYLNKAGNVLDRTLLTEMEEEDWVKEARYIQENLTPEDISRAFSRLPREVQDETSKQMQEDLQQRLEDLDEYARQYSRILDRKVALRGTEKDDKFLIERLEDGSTKVTIRRLLSDEKNELMMERVFHPDRTKELVIYGLGDTDEFIVTGEGPAKIMVRLVGGYGEDTYKIANKRKVKAYDWEHEETIFTDEVPDGQISDIYKTHTYHWRFFDYNTNVLAPSLGFRTDDGLYLGVRDTYTVNGLNGNPFRQQHSLYANYFFRFKAMEVGYKGVFGNIFPKWNFEVEGYHTNNRYSTNYFGTGNETVNSEDIVGRDFYRSRMQISRASAGVAYHTLRFQGLYEAFKVMQMDDRFFIPANLNDNVFERQHYVGAETSLRYWNENAPDFPTKGLDFGLTAGYKLNTSDKDNRFGYLAFDAGFTQHLISTGDLVFATKAKVQTNFGDNYNFYHAPSIGGDNGLRGYRDERFTGKTAFYHTSDLRLRALRFISPLSPISAGVYGGFDYGRVWTPAGNSNTWHTSTGGGVWMSAFNGFTFNAGYFISEESKLLQVGLGFDF